MPKLLSLDTATDTAVCGHKAASLAALRSRGFDVPDGFVIPVGVRASREDVDVALARLGNGPVAVRSSGVAEDLADASFAGQYDTVLNVQGADAVLAAAAACVTSADGARVGMYAGGGGAMAVLVQRMVEAEVSGVAFSANPVTGNRGEVRVSATRGLGDRLVSGEIDADEWAVTAHRASAVRQPQQVVDEALARRVAALARQAEEARRAPQDIEWAVSGDRLWLLQSRPITALPVAPQIDVPAGTWQKDAGHIFEPLSPFAASTQFRDAGVFLAEAIEQWGLLPDRVGFAVIGHEAYLHVEPDDGGKPAPPWWVLAIVARLVPALRRKLKAAEKAVEAGRLDAAPAEWDGVLRPRLRREIEAYAAVDLSALEQRALFRHIDELAGFYTRSLQLHFSLTIPYCVGLYELTTICRELLGWELGQTVSLLQGLSSASTAPSDELAAIVRRACERGASRDLVLSRRPDVMAHLESVDPDVAVALQQYLRFWGLRPVGPEVGSPCVFEQPQLIADLIADVAGPAASADRAAKRTEAVRDARARLTGPARERFDAALAYAERVYPLREDNVLLTDQLPVGLLRRAAIEAGRRLVSAGLVGQPADALMLTVSEIEEALRASSDVRALVARRRSEHAWVRANPGPMVYGPAPAPSPDLRGLPVAARRVNEALLWMLDHEIAAPPAPEGDAVAGIGVSPGVHRGRVRVITAADQLHRLRQGEVLVCPSTSAAWMMVFRRAGAIVTDTGSVLAHTAIVAREFALPAVVATGNATSRFVDGEEVIVDGARGTVMRA